MDLFSTLVTAETFRYPQVVYCTRRRSGSAVLQQAGDGGAVDQRRQAGGEDDAAELPPLPVQRGAAHAQRDRLQPRQPMAAAGAAEEDRELVADEFAATAGENGRAIGEARPVLLADARAVHRNPAIAAVGLLAKRHLPVPPPGGEPSDEAAVWRHGAAARCAGGTGWVELGGAQIKILGKKRAEWRLGGVL